MPRGVGLLGWEGGYICILRADSRFCTAETRHYKAIIFQLKNDKCYNMTKNKCDAIEL